VLYVIAQQLLDLLGMKADMKSYNHTATLELEGTLITMKPKFNVIFTMSPGYAGRPKLSDNLAALSRPVAMMVLDYALFGHIKFYEFGFADARVFKFFKGLSFSGVWCCFDELNCINVDVLSLIAQQLLDLFGRTADMKSYSDSVTLEFDETLFTMKPTFYVSINMSPDYAGRDNLLLRSALLPLWFPTTP